MKILVLGAMGSMGSNHCRVYKELGHTVLANDIDSGLEQYCNDNGYLAITDTYDAFENEDIDAVSICTPTPLHTKHIIEALMSDKSILAEKPIAINNQELIQIEKAYKLALSRNPECKFASGYLENFNTVISTFENKIAKNGEQIEDITFIRRGPIVAEYPEGGVMLDLTVHDIDLITRLAKKQPNWIRGDFRYRNGDNYEKNAQLTMMFENDNSKDIIATAKSGWETDAKVRVGHITTDKSSYILNLDAMKLSRIKRFEGDSWTDYVDLKKKSGRFENIPVEPREPLKDEISDFLDSVKNNREPLVGLERGAIPTRYVELAKKWRKREVVIY